MDHLILIAEVEVDRFFRHAQMFGNVIHRYAFYAVPEKQLVGSGQYSFFIFHGGKKFRGKTMETFFDYNVSSTIIFELFSFLGLGLYINTLITSN
jgi:hypothetical protein